MARSRRPPRPLPPAEAPGPGTSQPMAELAAGSGGEDEELEICNEDGFVFKRARGLYTDDALSSAKAVGPDSAAARRRRSALLRLRDKRLRELSRWEALSSNLLVPLPAPQPPPPQASPASPRPAVAASASVLDDLLAQAEVQAELLNKVAQYCDEIQALCDAHEADIVDAIVALPIWGDPKELMKSLCSPAEHTGDLDFRKDTWQHKHSEENGGFQRLDSRQDRRQIEAGSYKDAAVQKIKNSGEARKMGSYQCKSCSQFCNTEKLCCEAPAELGDELPQPILAENRKRKGVASPSGSNSVAAQAPNKSKRKKACGIISTPSGTQSPVSQRRITRKSASRTRAEDTFCSPEPATRRRAAAAARNVSPGGSS